jgi:hypothetical protein
VCARASIERVGRFGQHGVESKRLCILAQMIGSILIAGWHRVRFPLQCLRGKLGDPDMTQCCLQLHMRVASCSKTNPLL